MGRTGGRAPGIGVILSMELKQQAVAGTAESSDIMVTIDPVGGDAVEISLDRGATWTTYELGEVDPLRWVNWKFTFTPEAPGSYLLMVRAVAEDGSVSTDPSQLFFNVQ